MLDPSIKKELIMEHYLHPLNKGPKEDSNYVKVNINSETCIDNIDLYIYFDNDTIKDISFDGEACAISTSAASIMTKLLKGKKISEVRELISNYYKMINHEEYNEELLEEACCYDEIYKQQNRIGCATIPWRGIEKALKQYESK